MGNWNTDLGKFAGEHPILTFLIASSVVSGITSAISSISKGAASIATGENMWDNKNSSDVNFRIEPTTSNTDTVVDMTTTET